jgi:hypothetical protein
MIAFRFNVGIDHLIVEKPRGLRRAGNTPIIVIQQAAENRANHANSSISPSG